MPDPQIYEVTDPTSGRKVTLQGDSPPTEAELNEIFSKLNSPQTAAVQKPTLDTSTLGAIGRGLSNVWEQVNPVTAVKGAYQAVTHPIDTAENIGAAHKALYDKAAESFKQGDYVNGAVHGLNMLIPLIGPTMDQAAEQIASGDVAGGVGKAAGLGLALSGPKIASAGVKAAAEVPRVLPTAVADLADRISTNRLADVMAPKVGPNKARFGNIAQKVAPQLAREPDLGAMSREGLQQAVESKLNEAGDMLDAAADARNAKQVVYTGPILKALQAQRDKLTAMTARVGSFKAGADVTPMPNASQAAVLDKAISEVKALGPVVNYDALRTVRQAYDKPAKAIYAPSLTQDYMAKMGDKLGSADVTSVLRDTLAQMDPATAEANARYSLFKNANDVLQATKEMERVRPNAGRAMVARAVGALVGEHAGGLPGAAAGAMLGPSMDDALRAGLTTKISTARALASLADAIRSGKPAQINGALYRFAAITGRTAKLKALLSGQAPVLSSLPAAASDQTVGPQ